MENITLEEVVQRLDRLEKMMTEINQKLSGIVEEVVPDVPKDSETAAALRGAEALKNDKQDARIGTKVIEEILEKMGYPSDFKPRPLEEVRKSMVESGIRPEDNEFSRAIIAEREK